MARRSSSSYYSDSASRQERREPPSHVSTELHMQIFRHTSSPLRPADSASFVGPAQTKLLASHEVGDAVHLYRVEFAQGARTNWHTHSGPQWLFVIDGTIRIQQWGEA